MGLLSDDEILLEKQAMIWASDQPMSNHADSCPYLMSGRRRYCRCNVFSAKMTALKRAADGLPPLY